MLIRRPGSTALLHATELLKQTGHLQTSEEHPFGGLFFLYPSSQIRPLPLVAMNPYVAILYPMNLRLPPFEQVMCSTLQL